MQTPELKTPETPQQMQAEISRPLRHDPFTGDPLAYPGLSAAIEARLVLMMRGHGIGRPGFLDMLLTTFDEESVVPRNRVRTLLLLASGLLARCHRIITKADWEKILGTPGGFPQTAMGQRVERYKRLLARVVVEGVIRRGEVERASV